MILTKNLEIEILKFHDSYWDYYLKGNVEGMIQMLDDGYTQVGSAEMEVFSNKPDAVKFLYDTIDQVAGNLEMRNRITKLESQAELFIAHEQCDIYVKTDEKWVFYSKFRATSLIQHKTSGWKFIHQHSSFPDSRTGEGENVAIDKIALENEQLKEAIKRRTIELEHQNRELEIEAAVEKVRSESMAMQSTDDFSKVNKELLHQLNKLDIPGLTGVSFYLVDENGLVTVRDLSSPGNMSDPSSYAFQFDSKKYPILGEFVGIWKAADLDYFILDYPKKKLEQAVEELQHIHPVAAQQFKNAIDSGVLTHQWNPVGRLSNGILSIDLMQPPSGDTKTIVLKMAGAFNMAYQRFLDLQKAEAQAREAQIEAALERVRSKALAMHTSNDIMDVVLVLREQMEYLGNEKLESSNIHLYYDENQYFDVWWSNKPLDVKDRGIITGMTRVPLTTRWAREAVKKYFTNQPTYEIIATGETLKEWYEYMNVAIPEIMVKDQQGQLIIPERLHYHFARFSGGALLMITEDKPTAVAIDLQKRAAGVFSLAYQRFLDLQKAEAQVQEARIEAALERVRSKTMAMHNSNDVGETAAVMEDELKKLGIDTIRCGIGIMHEPGDMEVWTISKNENNKTEIIIGWLDMHIHPLLKGAFESWRNKNESYSYELKDDDLLNYYNAINNYPGYPIRYKTDTLPKQIHHNEFYFPEGILFAFSLLQLTDDQRKIFKRFASVFSQTYRRYLDLSKAEAQAREAQIEVAVERVRAKALAMHKSGEIMGVAVTMRKELETLNMPGFDAATITLSQEDGTIRLWDNTSAKQHEDGTWENTEFIFRLEDNHPDFYLNKIWSSKDRYIVVEQDEHDLKITTDWVRRHDKNLADVVVHYYKENGIKQAWHPAVALTYGRLNLDFYVYAPKPEVENILIKMAAAFDLAYKRFLDLQNAEAQARESQIQLALERVRSRSMAMHKSDELKDVIKVIHDQLIHLNFELDNAGFFIDPKESNDYNSWDASADLPMKMHTPYFDHPINKDYIHHRDYGPELFAKSYSFEEKNSWWKELFNRIIGIPDEIKPAALEVRLQSPGLAISRVFMKNIGLYVLNFSGRPFSDENNAILLRFGRVFEQSYTRFNDLKIAEAQAREAQIETALERVRSRTLAMQKSEELAETAAVLFQQLISLGIAPNRLFIILIKENSSDMEAWLTDEDGSKVNEGFIGNYTKNSSLLKMYEGWKEKRASLVIDMQGAELQEYFHYLHKELNVPFKGGLEQKRRLQYIAYFSHGLIGMASPDEQPIETLQLLERFASVFNLTFTRFNDLKIAEAHAVKSEQDLIAIKEAKQKAEEALSELQATQKQLLQSEKMASLGELTAGIAHEIQNPLNFVNNFSDVNKELLSEMIEEITNGNFEEVKSLAKDVIENEEKINHHGKRAESIVKGMLEHSRKSTGIKEPTDINKMCDEYVRLSYHGLRAKDKNFNCDYKLDLDPSLPMVNVIPQDIGRVILNVVNNAFQACLQQLKSQESESQVTYKPLVSISTHYVASPHRRVSITISDNGPGIPPHIKDKIFQPFFTTKPTGQGTGLGLSLAYDIIKAHGGEITVESKIGYGAEFIIKLPISL